LLEEVLSHCRENAVGRNTDEIIADVDQELTGAERLRRLMRAALTSDEKLERGIRSWGRKNAKQPTVSRQLTRRT
jgi:hypothetical protein